MCDRPPGQSGCEIMELLLEKGADPDITGGAQYVALFAAAENGDIEVIARLLAAGVDVNTSCIEKKKRVSLTITGLGVAVEYDRADAVEVFLHMGANPNCDTPLCVPAMLRASADFINDKIFSFLLEAGADVNAVDWTGNSYLHEAASTGSYSKVYRLLEAGATTSVGPSSTGEASKFSTFCWHMGQA